MERSDAPCPRDSSAVSEARLPKRRYRERSYALIRKTEDETGPQADVLPFQFNVKRRFAIMVPRGKFRPRFGSLVTLDTTASARPQRPVPAQAHSETCVKSHNAWPFIQPQNHGQQAIPRLNSHRRYNPAPQAAYPTRHTAGAPRSRIGFGVGGLAQC